MNLLTSVTILLVTTIITAGAVLITALVLAYRKGQE